MTRPAGLVLALSLGLALLASPARGQEGGEDDEARRELAKQLFVQANEEAREGRYRAAIPLYERALKLAPNVAALHRNVAVVYQKVGRCDLAVVHFDRYMELRPDAPDADAVHQERSACQEVLRDRPDLARESAEDGTLTLVVNVDGAAVTVDGVLMGQTPIQPLNLKPATYNILISKPGYEPWQRRFPVAAGRDVVVNVTLVIEQKRTGDDELEDRHLVWKWTTIGAGSALVATGVVFTVLAELDRSEFEGTKKDADGDLLISQTRAKALQDSVNTNRTVSYVMYGLGGAAAVGGVLWLVLDRPKKTGGEGTVTPVSAGPIPGGGVVTFSGSF
jgi:tetratricopeptide (TPR) repeat protein